jgi:hypothetical protein
MTRRTISMLAAVVLGVLAFAVAGCGGDSNSSATPETTATETTTTTEETTTTEATETTETTPSGTAFATAGNCAELSGLGQKISRAFSGSGDTDIQQVADDFQELAANAPSEIKADFQTIADAYSKIADALEGVDLQGGQPSAEAIQKLQQLSSEIDQAKLTQAAQNISTWVTQNCKS